uniref:Uncharacterized protein n=1 Tax=Arundo donax TaxID=35708 RepID=A0A0A8YYS0_ARUDO
MQLISGLMLMHFSSTECYFLLALKLIASFLQAASHLAA